jgi:transcriptional regulator with XRE-family HTH domain
MKHNRYAGNEEHLRRLLRHSREQRNLTQAALAAILQKPQSFVSKYEAGERLLSFVETIDVCRALDLEPSALVKEYLPHHEA